ncbi:hypothetical protein BKA70DRAFT_815076 [Coprinopsis sp. MPI-PUGE-AT-0042]|nr:hypothetical protein BKA70DRAFT_815076 [Coprinopsis sp. MPI-PUGE-AT-0042]
MDPPRKPGMRERFKGGLKEGKQWLKGHLRSRPASPLPSGTSTPQVADTEHDLPSNQQATDTPPSAIYALTPRPHSLPRLQGAAMASGASESINNDSPAGMPPSDPTSNQTDKAKGYLNVTGSFIQLVLKKVPDAIDSNPVKVLFSLAKIVVQLKEGMDDNKDAVEQHIITTSRLLLTVEAALHGWTGGKAPEEMEAMEMFKEEAKEQFRQLLQIENQSRLRNFAVQEDDKRKIAQIFVCIDRARERLMLAMTARIHQIVAKLEAESSRSLHDRLRISREADYMYDLAGEALGRSQCTPGTRISILEAIIRWATDLSNSECIFWLSGHAGTGKSTITLTICHLLETLAEKGVDLGGTFFCSRQFPTTQAVSAIIRTLVYRLSLKSKAFKAALEVHGNFEAVDHAPKSQLEKLLVIPWKESALGRLANKEPVSTSYQGSSSSSPAGWILHWSSRSKCFRTSRSADWAR